MESLPSSIQNCIKELSKLPGIGSKTATRLAFHLLNRGQVELDSFGMAVKDLKKDLCVCGVCSNISEHDPCPVCANEERDHAVIMVVEDPMDVIAFEQTNDFNGVYHVLHGVLSPIDGITPDHIRLKELFIRLESLDTAEVIIATNPSIEGEATAHYIREHITKPDINVTRIAKGLPYGGDLEYADSTTLRQSLSGRIPL